MIADLLPNKTREEKAEAPAGSKTGLLDYQHTYIKAVLDFYGPLTPVQLLERVRSEDPVAKAHHTPSNDPESRLITPKELCLFCIDEVFRGRPTPYCPGGGPVPPTDEETRKIGHYQEKRWKDTLEYLADK
ncbi:hypothetical protein [Corynebacterium mastitidis]|uniref:hypothetical protein n=1 Tax=Corynebacterium mastitidis TaxID=161890 RepID=UPI0012EA6E70|nr:hypothetical protein [Corynebacterium mastitidis]